MSVFPEAFDDNTDLYLVHDSLRVVLAEDYTPGDTVIVVAADPVFVRFPSVGIITLTEQCSEPDKRAVSFFYGTTGTNTAGLNTFGDLQLLPCFEDVPKARGVTDVTQNVMALHHNVLKDALIAIERFIGLRGDISKVPLQGTMEARINFLRQLVLQPKSWFAASSKIGVVPLCVQMFDFSTREPNVWIWDFGDGDISIISRTDAIQTGNVSKCYYTPGIYNVTLTVENDFGTNALVAPKYINARMEAPDLAQIAFAPTPAQIVDMDIIRTRANSLVNILVTASGEKAGDPIVKYTWNLTDDLLHDNTDVAKASYSVGGTYDVTLRTDTSLGAFRITEFPNAIDVVENFNLWHFIFDPNGSGITKNLYAYEFALASEVYKIPAFAPTISVTRDPGFLDGVLEEAQQKAEFARNNGFTPRTLVSSGNQGASLLFWAGGASDPSDAQEIFFKEFNGFNGVWTTPSIGGSSDKIDRQWNWLSLASASNVYFFFGDSATLGKTDQTLTNLQLNTYSVGNSALSLSNYTNGADELMVNVGGGSDGNFSVYRGTWKDSAGYWVRNDGTGVFFRLKSFYHTEGTLGNPVQLIRKLTDMPGTTKFEGQMVPLTNGVYFFNNTGEVAVYNPTTNVWQTGGPGVNSPVFAGVQDQTVADYDDPKNTLLATSDNDHTAYLSYDYSVRAFIKFSELDLTFSTLPVRPSGEQFVMGVY